MSLDVGTLEWLRNMRDAHLQMAVSNHEAATQMRADADRYDRQGDDAHERAVGLHYVLNLLAVDEGEDPEDLPTPPADPIDPFEGYPGNSDSQQEVVVDDEPAAEQPAPVDEAPVDEAPVDEPDTDQAPAGTESDASPEATEEPSEAAPAEPQATDAPTEVSESTDMPTTEGDTAR